MSKSTERERSETKKNPDKKTGKPRATQIRRGAVRKEKPKILNNFASNELKKERNLKGNRKRREKSQETHTCEDIQIWWWHLLEAYCKEDKSCMPQSLLSSL